MPTSEPENRRPTRTGNWRRVLRPGVLVAPWAVALALVALQGPNADTARGVAANARSATTDALASNFGGDPQIEATAVRLVRDAVTTQHKDRVTALDVAVPEHVQALATAAWLVRVQVVVLQGDRQRWRSADHQVWAVPVGVSDGQVVGLDRPWRVADPPSHVASPTWQRATIPAEQVHAALRRAGLQPADDVEVQQHPQLAGVIRAGVLTDGATGHVWLRTEPLQVLGASLRRRRLEPLPHTTLGGAP